jgi:hypothetical protein
MKQVSGQRLFYVFKICCCCPTTILLLGPAGAPFKLAAVIVSESSPSVRLIGVVEGVLTVGRRYSIPTSAISISGAPTAKPSFRQLY